MQSKQQSTEKTGVDVWPNVSLTRAELRSKVRSLIWQLWFSPFVLVFAFVLHVRYYTMIV